MKYEGYLENVAVISDTGSRNSPMFEDLKREKKTGTEEKGEKWVEENVTRALIEPIYVLSLFLCSYVLIIHEFSRNTRASSLVSIHTSHSKSILRGEFKKNREGEGTATVLVVKIKSDNHIDPF